MAFISSLEFCAEEDREAQTAASASRGTVSLFIKIVLVTVKIQKIVRYSINIVKPYIVSASLYMYLYFHLLKATGCESPVQ